MIEPDLLTRDELEALRALDTCAVANAIEALNVRLKNEGFTDGSIRRFTANERPVLGYAATIKIRCSSPPAVGPNYIERTQWWDYLLTVPEPRFLFIQDVDPAPGTGALVGEVHAHILKALQCVAVATNGAVRDVPEVSALGFSMFAARLSVSHAYAHIVETGCPVEAGGLQIAAGDLVHGDCHGLISIPLRNAREIPAMALEMKEREQTIINICESDGFSIERLRAAIRELRPAMPDQR
jgi:4-hydroxy-4-methyl-2-oxoglutarate aldolase